MGSNGQVYAGIIDGAGVLAGLFRSGNGGASWTEMDVPSIHPGQQGSIHFSILADPGAADIVYLGGDRQAQLPSDIGGMDWTGNLVRCDASRPLGQQCVHLTHSRLLPPAGGGTANSSPARR